MENLKKAKERAESFLCRIILQKWNSFVKKNKKPLDYWETIDWSLRFEAYSYLGYRNKKNIEKFAIEIRNVWDEWIELNNKGHIGSEKIFWPTVYKIMRSRGSGGNEERFHGNEIESHVSMFRAKEILRIGGYEAYFNEAKKRIIDILFSKPHLSLSGFDMRTLRFILRSSFLKFALSDYLKVIALKLIESEDFVLNVLTPRFQGWYTFYLCFGNFGSDLIDSAKKTALKLINEQDKNGSFDNSVLATCQCASTIHYMKLDRSNSVCNRALDYILKEQNKEGYWDFLWSWTQLRGYNTDWNILSTVIALETLDLITDDRPLPIWFERIEPFDTYQKQKHSRIQPVVSFKTPKGINWHDVSIRFISEESVQIRAGSASEGRDFVGMGFEHRRTGEPDLCWRALKEFARHQGEISLNDEDVNLRIKKNLKYYVYAIRNRLIELFKISGDPFEKYNRKTRAWKAKFAVIDIPQE